MKKIVFLIIASLLVIGLVLPGCEGGGEEEFDHWIDIACPGPMTFIYGEHAWQGVTLAAEEINDAGGVDIGGVMHGIRVTKVETNETNDMTGTDGILALTAVIDDVDFVMGGYQETAMAAYREVAMDEGKIFIAASLQAHQVSVLEDYEGYKYWFQGPMVNDLFVDDMFGAMFTAVMGSLAEVGGNYTPRIAIVAEDEEWADIAVAGMEYILQSYGWWVGSWRVATTATTEEMLTVLAQINPEDPHMIFTVFSGPAGIPFSTLVREAVPYALCVGSNNEASRGEFADITIYDPGEPPGCAYEVTATLFSPGVEITSKSAAFASAYYDRWGNSPTLMSGFYDHVYWLMQSVEAAADELSVSDIADIVSAVNIDELIQIHEQSTWTGATSEYGYYPMPIELAEEVTHPAFNVTTAFVLSEEDVNELYPDLASYNITYDPALWTAPPHYPHSVIYGPGWTTGIVVQWQEVSPGEWGLVSIWPTPLFPDDPAYWEMMMEVGWINQWGYWNFAYPGGASLEIPDWWTSHHFPE